MESINTSNSGLPKDKQTNTDLQQLSPSQSFPNSSTQQASTNMCVVCSTRQRAVAFTPCGHFAACVACGHSLKTCPTCGSNIKGLLRIFQ